ncbi:hypothetical protein [Ferrimonas pelagia]|uniref:Uncharacterized protein n=1 Tax=Ferrimonas pelagia TaxID=1177826 RepID=A0ABP9ETG8_9GAMM
MNKTTFLIAAFILVALISSFFIMKHLGQSNTATADSTMPAKALEAIECSAYYQLSADTIERMQVQRMLPVAKRLAQSAQMAERMAQSLSSAQDLTAQIEQAKQNHLATLPDPNQLGPLMSKYREPCQTLLSTG